MFAAVYISVIAIQTDLNDGDGITLSSIVKNKVFISLILSVMSTYGIWLIASLLMFDPWHMITSLVQYLLLDHDNGSVKAIALMWLQPSKGFVTMATHEWSSATSSRSVRVLLVVFSQVTNGVRTGSLRLSR